jgi:dihydroxy-acid dehydratase
MMPPGSSTPGPADPRRPGIARAAGRRIVQMVRDEVRPSTVLTAAAFRNAVRMLMALGGSTNAVIHLTAVAGRMGIRLTPERINAISDETPALVDLKPVGEGYMEDFNAAGGVGAVLRELRELLHLDCMTVDGRTLRERIDEPLPWIDRKVIRTFNDPISPHGGLIVLRGTLAPDGAVFKRAAATPSLFEVEGRAVVFENLEDLAARIDDPALDVLPNDFLVLKNAGPHGATMPEAGYLPIPAKLARAGVKDMVRISDARMSGTAYGTIVLHTSPEAAVGGPLAAVRNGDRIALSVAKKRIDLLVEEHEVARRLEGWRPPPMPTRGYAALYRRSVLQAPQGCDFDFLTQS